MGKEAKRINKIKVVLAMKGKTNIWLAEQMNTTPQRVSKWVTNTVQPSLENLREIAMVLDVEIGDLLWPVTKEE